MGGSGGSFGSGFDPRDIAKQVQETEAKIDQATFKTKLEGVFASLLSDYNDRDKDLVRRRMDDILETLDDLAEGELDMVFGGSVAKHTYIEGLSDIDCLLLLNGTDLEGKGPQAVSCVMWPTSFLQALAVASLLSLVTWPSRSHILTEWKSS